MRKVDKENSVWVVLIKLNQAYGYAKKISLRVFKDEAQAYVCANLYNSGGVLKAEVLLLPITESVELDESTGKIKFHLLGDEKIEGEV